MWLDKAKDVSGKIIFLIGVTMLFLIFIAFLISVLLFMAIVEFSWLFDVREHYIIALLITSIQFAGMMAVIMKIADGSIDDYFSNLFSSKD